MMMEAFGDISSDLRAEPDWGTLIDFGLPVGIPGIKRRNRPFPDVMRSLVIAVRFLDEHREDNSRLREYDGFKSLLLALKTHYPSTYRIVEEQAGRNLSHTFELTIVLGRHIKLRNICLAGISRYFSREGILPNPDN